MATDTKQVPVSNGTPEAPKVEETTGTPKAIKAIDAYFSIEHQGMIAAKYDRKYPVEARRKHRSMWPEFTGNPFVLYVLAETLTEAKRAVFSENIKSFIRKMNSAMEDYTPTVAGAVLTELQVSDNKITDTKLQSLYQLVEDEDDRTTLCKRYAEQLKQSIKTGKDADRNRLIFYHAAATMGVIPNTIW